MQSEARSERTAAAQARPLAELLECPPGTGALLNGAARCIDVDVGEVVFRQSEACRGLYVVIAGQYLRRTERLETRLNLGVARAGDLVELAAVLGDGRHTYTLSAQTGGSLRGLSAVADAVAGRIGAGGLARLRRKLPKLGAEGAAAKRRRTSGQAGRPASINS